MCTSAWDRLSGAPEAAVLLTKLALMRRIFDNISVVVVHLRRRISMC
jgi:hypothetical protein